MMKNSHMWITNEEVFTFKCVKLSRFWVLYTKRLNFNLQSDFLRSFFSFFVNEKANFSHFVDSSSIMDFPKGRERGKIFVGKTFQPDDNERRLHNRFWFQSEKKKERERERKKINYWLSMRKGFHVDCSVGAVVLKLFFLSGDNKIIFHSINEREEEEEGNCQKVHTLSCAMNNNNQRYWLMKWIVEKFSEVIVCRWHEKKT